jgi:N-acyl-D-amino-acid deacylase
MSRLRADVVIRGGTIVDGSGGEPFEADVTIVGDRIAAIGPNLDATAPLELDARGLAVAPGFINILSWSAETLLEDGRSQGNIRQGVTTEVFGEGESMGPLTPELREWLVAQQGDITYDVTWTTLAEFLETLEAHGIAPNVGSFVGATTVRIHELGWGDAPATPAQLAAMTDQVRLAMEDGALGVGSSLIYIPATFADTDELIALAREAGKADGLYISHIRNESDRLAEAIDEVVRISREADCRAEIYHLKAAGRDHWPRIEDAIARIEGARAAGVPLTADMYPYAASGTGLDATMPAWVQVGGQAAWSARLGDPEVRARLVPVMREAGDGWENELHAAGGPEGVMVVGFRTPGLQHLTGRTIASIAAERGTSPEETVMDLVIEDGSRVSCVFFSQSEDVVRRVAGLPWVSIGSDEASYAPEGVFLHSQPHPRAYGSFARFVGPFVRDGIVPGGLAEAVRRVSAQPAEVLRLDDRGRLLPGLAADVVVFDPARLQDHATFEAPHQYATGVEHVLVNGVPTLLAGEHTGATGGRFLRGPGWRGHAGGAA